MFAYTAGHAFDKAKPTLVFVHGAGLDHSSFLLQSRYFAYHGWNVLAVDLPGHGRTPGSPISSVSGMAEWLLKEVAAEKFSIVGHSMGALVALECAASAPSRVDRIAMMGVAYPMKVGEAFLDAAKRDHYDAFDMHTIWGHAAQVPLGGDPTPACGCTATRRRASSASRRASSTTISRRATTTCSRARLRVRHSSSSASAT